MKPSYHIQVGNIVLEGGPTTATPQAITIERDMDVPCDLARFRVFSGMETTLSDQVTVQLGYADEQTLVFTGQVAAIRPQLNYTEIVALGQAQALLSTYVSAEYLNHSVGAIVRTLSSEAGINTGTVDDGPNLPRFLIGQQQSAYQHLRALADRLGFELYTNRDGELMFHDVSGGGLGLSSPLAGATGFRFGEHILSLSASEQQPTWQRVEVSGESPISGEGDRTVHWLTAKQSDYRGQAGNGQPTLIRNDPVARTKDLADTLAAGRLAHAQRRVHCIAIHTPGQSSIELGDSVSTEGLHHAVANGNGYVRTLKHQFNGHNGFTTYLSITVGDAA